MNVEIVDVLEWMSKSLREEQRIFAWIYVQRAAALRT
jgi:hypothetical protein